MTHRLPDLGFSADALHPFLSPETLEYHHGKHHRGYVDKLNGALEGHELRGLGLSELVRRSQGGLFNNAAQHFNHSLYWRSVAPDSADSPGSGLARQIEADFGSVAALEEAFKKAAVGHFGSGWCWLAREGSGKLRVETTSDAACPLTAGRTPVLTCDVWEHAYYIDYRNARPDYVDAFWRGINWTFATLAFDDPDAVEATILGTSS